jgi:hypothetical protein
MAQVDGMTNFADTAQPFGFAREGNCRFHFLPHGPLILPDVRGSKRGKMAITAQGRLCRKGKIAKNRRYFPGKQVAARGAQMQYSGSLRFNL